MTRKTCLRCDWEGETSEPGCPDCGIRPLYVLGAVPPEAERTPAGSEPDERGHVPPSTAPPAPTSSPPPDPSDPAGRSIRATVALVLAPLLLFVVVGTWLNAHEVGSSLAASTSATPHVASTVDDASTSVPIPPLTTEVVGPPTGLDVGRQSLAVEGVAFSFSVPSDGWWRFGDLFVSKSTISPPSAEAIVFWTSVDNGAYADACGQWWGSPDGSVADWARRASRTRGTELVKGPQHVTVGGHAAQHVVFTVRKNVACNPGFFHRWKAVEEGPFWSGMEVGDTIRIWLMNIGGTILYVEGDTHDYAGAHLRQEVEKIVASMKFE
jgi:hypothetical protein